MNTPTARFLPAVCVGAVLGYMATPGRVLAESGRPASKLYVSDVSGAALIQTGDTVHDVTKRSVYDAQGVVIDTRQPAAGQEQAKTYSTMVYSNGTGAYFDADTRVEVRKFVQEPFTPNRSDAEVEPSISQTQAFVSHGTVGLCTSKLVAGSRMVYSTAFGSVAIHGGKFVIDAQPKQTVIASLDGDSIVRAGNMDMGGHTLHAGEEAIIRPTQPGEPNTIEIVKIPRPAMNAFDDKVAMACLAKKTVYFEQRSRQDSKAPKDGSPGGDVDAFTTHEQTTRSAGGPFKDAQGEIIALPVVPSELPVQYAISPASIPTNGQAANPPNANPPPGPGG